MPTRSPKGADEPETPSSALSDWTKTSRPPGPAQTPAGERAFTPGTLLAGRYRVVALLGKGGMGEVYRAEDTKLAQTVALKFVRGTLSPEALARLYAEVRIGRQISHPNVCPLYDVAEVGGETFLTMEYVDGEDLGSLLQRIGRLAPDKALDLARDLCAGLAAVHDKGVVHRDLKPANVMVDGRGRARLTDLGLALALGTRPEEGVAGTPAYMSPEQLEGREATPRSDLYALGLILFEMFTGRRFYDARTMSELRTQHRQAKASRLASASGLLDPVVERAVLECLEEDPAARPASARLVLARLPGADPLDAAVAAGETPSPELVAAANRVGDLSPGAAWAGLLAALGGLVLVAHLVDRTSFLSRATVPRSPASLAERSREVLLRLGHPAGADAAYGFEIDQGLLVHALADRSPERWRKLREGPSTPFRFYYRQSPRALVAENRDGVVRRDDPPSTLSGMAEVVLDAQGRLTSFTAIPPQLEASSGPWPDPDWSALFREAGLLEAPLRAAEPSWASPVDSDRKASWEGSYPGESEPSIRVEAAAYHGRPVWFTVLRPWSRPERMAESQVPRTTIPVGGVAVMVLALALPLGGIVLARHNLRRGRGDRKGAFRVALFVFVVYGLARVLRADHVASFGPELWLLIKVLAYPSFWALQVWLLYMALEPYARRRWPHLLISWKRLLAGKLSDPLVGRDVLLGCLAGSLATLTFLLTQLVPTWLGGAPLLPQPFVYGETLTAFHHVAFRLFVNQYSAVLFALVFLFMLVLLRLLFRSTAVAVALWCPLVAWPLFGQSPLVEWASGLLRALLLLVVLSRGGLLALATSLFVLFGLLEAPLTLDLSSWYAPRALPVVLVIAAIAAYGFHTSLAGKPPFGRSLLED
jgi:serine/threonine-protein kinase